MKLRSTLQWVAATALAVVALAAQAATTIYYHNDFAGSPLVATDASGQVVWRESFRPFGERLVNSASAKGNAVWFTSRRQDVESGLVYMGARYYDPVVGRFYSMDPKAFDERNVHSHNRYSYANNNPYRFVDPDGRNPVLAALLANAAGGAAIGGGVAGLINAAVQLSETGSVRWRGAGGVLDAAGDGAEIGAIVGVLGAQLGGVAAGLNAGRQAQAVTARDSLSDSLAPLKGRAPATVTAGYNTKTGEIAARACSGGRCAEDHVVEALGGNPADVRFTSAVRPRTGEEVPVCIRCEETYGRSVFAPGTRFKSDE